MFKIATRKPWEIMFFKWAISIAIISKFMICLVIYIKLPSLVERSDAVLYYYPQTLHFISGHLPYKDFYSSYSILFAPMLSLAVMAWNSVGAIVLMMLIFETGMIILYLFRCSRNDNIHGWRTAYLYLLSPISFYWVAFVGYNSPIIVFFTIWGLFWAEKGRPVLASSLAALSLLFSKLLAVIMWPAFIFWRRRDIWRSSSPLIFVLLAHILLLAFGFDVLMPLKGEYNKYSSGNIWFALSLILPDLKNSRVWNILPALLFVILFFLLMLYVIKKRGQSPLGDFDWAMALIAVICLLFMLLSKKTFTMYVPMMLIFIIHTLMIEDNFTISKYIVLGFMGAVTTLEVSFYKQLIGGAPSTWSIVKSLSIDMPLIGCYLFLIIICVRVLFRQKESS
jgi:hypothetical protein